MKKNLANACSAIAVFLFSLPQPLLAETVPLTLGQPIVVPGTKEGVKSLGDVTTPAGTHTLAVDPNTHSVWIAFAKGEESYVAELKAN